MLCDTREQIAEPERLAEHCGSPGVLRLSAQFRCVIASQQQDRHGREGNISLQTGAERNTVAIRQRNVEHHQVSGLMEKRGHRLRASCRAAYDVAGPRQEAPDNITDAGLIIDDMVDVCRQ